MFDLVSLGLTLCRWLTGRVALQTIEDVEKSNPSSFTEYLRSWLQKDIDRIGTKLESQSHSKICSALHYVKRALRLIEQDVVVISKLTLFPKSYALPGVQNYLRDADKWATEAFFDKANVSAKWRLEALNVQLFCALLLHLNEPEGVLRIWREILDELMADNELVHSVLSKSWLFAANPEVKTGVLELVTNVRSALITSDCKNSSLITDIWRCIFHPKLESNELQLEWFRACVPGLTSYRIINNSYVLITLPYHQFCLLPQNLIATIVPPDGDTLSLKVISNDTDIRERTLTKDDQLNYCTVAYDEKRDAVLVVQRKSVLIFDKQLNYLGVFEDDGLNICDNKHILCSPNGVWVLCDETNLKLYVRWYSTTAAGWSNVQIDLPFTTETTAEGCKNFMTLMDIRDCSTADDVEIIIRITKNLVPRFFLIHCDERNSSVVEQREIIVENFTLLHLDEQSSVWMSFTENRETYLLLWSDSDQNISLLEVDSNGKRVQEYFVPVPVPFGLRHVVVKSPYIFCGVVPFACTHSDYTALVKQLKC